MLDQSWFLRLSHQTRFIFITIIAITGATITIVDDIAKSGRQVIQIAIARDRDLKWSRQLVFGNIQPFR